MDNAELAGKPLKGAAASVDDIPEALRDAPSPAPQRRFPRVWLVVGLTGLGSIVLVAGLWLASLSQPLPPVTKAENSSSPTSETNSANTDETAINAADRPDIMVGTSGHFAYQEAPAAELQAIVPNGTIRLRKAAAQKFQAMAAAARSQGVILVPISGFRSVAEQQHLFFDVKAQRGQVAAERAQVSAPPGYSEHHTGYAMDIGDGNVPATNLSPSFEKTAAFRWLQANAPYYSFELSFPKNNKQGVSYEPWHWRFVGDRNSLETFYKAQQLEK